MTTKVRLLTYADYLRIPDDGFRHEIVKGEEFMTPSPGSEHQSVVMNLGVLLKVHADGTGAGRVLAAPMDVVLSKQDVVQPDVLFVSKARLSIIESACIRGAPDLVVEVLSDSTATFDRGPKLALYAKSGAKECWLVDPAVKSVEVHEFGSPRRTRVLRHDQEFKSALFPGLTVHVRALFS